MITSCYLPSLQISRKTKITQFPPGNTKTNKDDNCCSRAVVATKAPWHKKLASLWHNTKTQ